MIISIIAAKSINNVIGVNGILPWNHPSDWDFFIDLTKGKNVIMGRVTYEEIQKYDTNFRNEIILTRSKGYADNKALWTDSLRKAIDILKKKREKEVFILGGEKPFKEGLSIAHNLYLTIIEKEYFGDRFLPQIDFTKWGITDYKCLTCRNTNLHFTEWEKSKSREEMIFPNNFKRSSFVLKSKNSKEDFSVNASKMISYNELNPIYDLISSHNIQEEIGFIVSLGKYSETKINSILDLGCGVGRYTEKLIKNYSKITGIDISRNSIDYANNKNSKVEYQYGNIKDWFSKRKFDLAICMWSTLNYLSKHSSIEEFFKTQHTNLKENGLLLIDIKNPDYIIVKKYSKKYFSFPYSINKRIERTKERDIQLSIYKYSVHNILTNEKINLIDEDMIKLYSYNEIISHSSNYFDVIKTFGDRIGCEKFKKYSSKRMVILMKRI